ncbi:multidrug transporter [Microbacterium sp.]|uniref:multidrug transporter n=1 Tax=Microbacterium sp. TaxID=51671 RepID=UPI002E337A1A|nr:multidrug transporter [Microbacterium sp.]HEX5729464.1 multidrug transporter [Microbacterium sp.]
MSDGEDHGSEQTGAERAAGTEMTDEMKRRDQLLRAAGSTEADAAPRIDVSKRDGVTRIDIAPDAVVRPGPGPGA